jgi:NDP-sugar pyrophosphorylase family protein
VSPNDRHLRITSGQPESQPRLSVVIMAGGFSPPPLAEAAGCSPLDLFVSTDQTVGDRWVQSCLRLSTSAKVDDMLCICGGSTPAPTASPGALRVIADETDYRGPAGSLRDALDRTPADSLVFVAEAARICNADLQSLVSGHLSAGAAVTVAAHDDGSPAGLYVLRRSTLDLVPHKGFMDFKEQWLGKVITEGLPVKVHHFPDGSCPQIRTRAEYIRAMLSPAGNAQPNQAEPDLEPRTLIGSRQTRSIICRGARVSDEAVVVDSVVMPGAVIEPEALVVRSLIASDTRVDAQHSVIDSVLGPRGIVRDPSTEPAGSSA